MELHLRGEQPGDEEALEVLNYRAFEPNNVRGGVADHDEADLVRGLRDSYPEFRARYSATAWEGETLVGHALFSPASVRLLGQTVRALAVGPVAVAPERQRQGVGGELLRFGHELGRQDGFQFALLIGHPEYYPRHGYRACFGFAHATFDRDALPAPTREFHRLPVRSSDLPWLVERGLAEYAEVDFAWLWGGHRCEWTLPGVNALVWWTDDGRRAAYTLSTTGPDKEWKVLLAEAPELAREVLATVRPATLEHHPSGWLARNVLDPAWAKCEAIRSDAAMACELQPGVLEPYLQALESGRPPGSCNWPLPFIACT